MPLMDIKRAAFCAVISISVSAMTGAASAAEPSSLKGAKTAPEFTETIQLAMLDDRDRGKRRGDRNGRRGDDRGSRSDRRSNDRGDRSGRRDGRRGETHERQRRAEGQRSDRRSDRRGDRRGDRHADRRSDRRSDGRSDHRRYDSRRDHRRYDNRRDRRRYDSRRDHRRYDNRRDRRRYDNRSSQRRYSRNYRGQHYGHGSGPRHGHGYYCSLHSLFHYNSGYDPVGWFVVSFGYDLFQSGYVGDCQVVSQSRRRGRYTEVALLCYDAFGYPYIKSGSRRSYRNY